MCQLENPVYQQHDIVSSTRHLISANLDEFYAHFRRDLFDDSRTAIEIFVDKDRHI